MEIDRIDKSELSLIASEVFGDSARVASVEEVRPVSDHGIWRITGCTWNLSYIVQLAGDCQKYLFRFNRRRYDKGDETIQKELEHYELIAQRTNIPTPRIRRADLSRSIVPTGYMVMDYMEGEHVNFLTHPNNPATSREDRDEIFHLAGVAVSQIHEITRPPDSDSSGTERVLEALDALARVVGSHQCRVTEEQIERCRGIVRSDQTLGVQMESLLLGDADLNFVKRGDRWTLSFICDLEWQRYGDPYFDLSHALCAPSPMWSLRKPLSGKLATEAARHPYFVGYEQRRPVDYERLSRIATYAHLCVMCSIARSAYQADEAGDISEREPPIFYDLLSAIESRG